MSKFLILILFSLFLSSANCKCKFGTFTDIAECDTQATPIQYKMYTSTSIEAGEWAYYYIPLVGIESNINLFFHVNGALPDAYLNFQPAYMDRFLPSEHDCYYSFQVQEGGQEMPPPRKIRLIEDFDEAIMILGLVNRDSSKIDLKVMYSATRDGDDDTSKKLIVGIIVSVVVAVVLFLCIGGYSYVKIRRYRRAAAIQSASRADIEAQSILRNNNAANDHLSLEDLQKYFPKSLLKTAKILSNKQDVQFVWKTLPQKSHAISSIAIIFSMKHVLKNGLKSRVSACKLGTFTDASLCDTKATLIQYEKYTSTSIEAGQWHYYYIPLRGINDNIELFFRINGPSPDGYLNFQLKTDDSLPTDSDSYYDFHARGGGQEMPFQSKINGIEDFDEAIMVFGLRNSGSSKTNIQIAYSIGEDDDSDENRALKKLIVGIIIGVAVAAGLLFCIGGYSMWMVRKLSHRNAMGAQNGLRIQTARTLQNNKDEVFIGSFVIRRSCEIFPKKPFKDFENPFQQTGCSVCLEDFTPEISCHQLYCSHIFHETCVEKWLDKHNSCPYCKVPIGKKLLRNFSKNRKNQMRAMVRVLKSRYKAELR